MNEQSLPTRQPFPAHRPPVEVVAVDHPPFELDVTSLPGWGVRLDVGATAWMAWYDPPDWSLTSVTYQRIPWAAQVHGMDGLEVVGVDWEAENLEWHEGMTQIVRLGEEAIEWLAVIRPRRDKRIISTFLDESFDRDFSKHPRQFRDQGLLRQTNGGFQMDLPADGALNACFAAGLFGVSVGSRHAECLRIIDLELRGGADASGVEALEKSLLAEAYYTREGRLFLFRRFNGRLWELKPGSPYAKGSGDWGQRFLDNARLVINGATFVHWYDCLTDASVRVDQS